MVRIVPQVSSSNRKSRPRQLSPTETAFLFSTTPKAKHLASPRNFMNQISKKHFPNLTNHLSIQPIFGIRSIIPPATKHDNTAV
jgi:hypothetical protein